MTHPYPHNGSSQTLGEILLAQGTITEAQLRHAWRLAVERKVSVEDILREEGLVTDELLERAMAELTSIPTKEQAASTGDSAYQLMIKTVLTAIVGKERAKKKIARTQQRKQARKKEHAEHERLRALRREENQRRRQEQERQLEEIRAARAEEKKQRRAERCQKRAEVRVRQSFRVSDVWRKKQHDKNRAKAWGMWLYPFMVPKMGNAERARFTEEKQRMTEVKSADQAERLRAQAKAKREKALEKQRRAEKEQKSREQKREAKEEVRRQREEEQRKRVKEKQHRDAHPCELGKKKEDKTTEQHGWHQHCPILGEESRHRDDSHRGGGEIHIQREEYTHQLWKNKPREAHCDDDREGDDNRRIDHGHLYLLLHTLIFFVLYGQIFQIFCQIAGLFSDTYQCNGVRSKKRLLVHGTPESHTVFHVLVDVLDEFLHGALHRFIRQGEQRIGHM